MLAAMNHGERPLVMVPRGAVVQVTADALDEDQLIRMEWNGQAFSMSTTNLMKHGVWVRETEAA